MKRLLATTAVLGLMAAAPAWADHDTWTILQDFDISSMSPPIDQNVDNLITGTNVSGTQTGSNTANSFQILDPGQETLSVGDSYDIQQLFDEDQVVDNKVEASGHVTVDQAGTNIANLGSILDPLGGTSTGDMYKISQEASYGNVEDGSQSVVNSIDPTGIEDSSQKGVNQVNALSITDTQGGVDSAGSLEVAQLVGGVFLEPAFYQSVENTAQACCIDGLGQEGSNKANLLTLNLANQTGGLVVDVTQDTSNKFDQSVTNTATATGSATDVTQSGLNAANVITVSPPAN